MIERLRKAISVFLFLTAIIINMHIIKYKPRIKNLASILDFFCVNLTRFEDWYKV